MPQSVADPQVLQLRHGHRVEVDGDDRIVVRASDGTLAAEIRITEAGIVVRASADEVIADGQRIRLSAAESVSISAPDVSIETTGDTRVVAAGELVLQGSLVRIN